MAINDCWYRKYEPKVLDDMILSRTMKKFVKGVLERGGLSNPILLHGKYGHGKTSFGKLLVRLLKLPNKIMIGNAESGKGYIKEEVYKFLNLQNSSKKVMLIDECLHEDEEISLVDGEYIRIGDMEKDKLYNIKSFNMETGKIEDDIADIISDKIDDIYEVELEDGRIIKLTRNHPFMVRDIYGNIIEKTIDDGLLKGDSIITI